VVKTASRRARHDSGHREAHAAAPDRGRAPRWKLVWFNDEGHSIFEADVIGEAELDELMEGVTRRPDFGAALAIPLPMIGSPVATGSRKPPPPPRRSYHQYGPHEEGLRSNVTILQGPRSTKAERGGPQASVEVPIPVAVVEQWRRINTIAHEQASARGSADA
jgi:hypothetical protein